MVSQLSPKSTQDLSGTLDCKPMPPTQDDINSDVDRQSCIPVERSVEPLNTFYCHYMKYNNTSD